MDAPDDSICMDHISQAFLKKLNLLFSLISLFDLAKLISLFLKSSHHIEIFFRMLQLRWKLHFQCKHERSQTNLHQLHLKSYLLNQHFLMRFFHLHQSKTSCLSNSLHSLVWEVDLVVSQLQPMVLQERSAVCREAFYLPICMHEQ